MGAGRSTVRAGSGLEGNPEVRFGLLGSYMRATRCSRFNAGLGEMGDGLPGEMATSRP